MCDSDWNNPDFLDRYCGFESVHLTEPLPEELSGDESGGETQNHSPDCEHLNRIRSSMGVVCVDCNLVVDELDYSFDCGDGGNRCQRQSVYTRSVDDVFAKNNLEEENTALDEVDKLYKTIVKRDKVRGESRDALIAICYRFHLLKKGDAIPLSDLKDLFNIDGRYLSPALTKYYRSFPQDRAIHLRPRDLVRRTLKLQRFDKELVLALQSQIQRMCDLAYNRSKKLNRSAPQSIASAMVYIYLRHSAIKIDRKLFAQRVRLSETTIDKFIKEIEKVFARG